MAATVARIDAAAQEAAALKDAISSRRAEAKSEAAARNIAFGSIHREKQQMAEANPESHWAEPPPQLPDWTPQSPYVWISKNLLTNLPVKTLSKNGDFLPEIAQVLAIDEKDRGELSGKLESLLAKYRSLEAASVDITTNPVEGIQKMSDNQITVTIHPIPEEAARVQDKFKSEMYSALGEQRGDIAVKLARWWMSEYLSPDSGGPKPISVALQPNGRYEISLKSGSIIRSVGGVPRLENYVPPHLLPFFSSLYHSSESAP